MINSTFRLRTRDVHNLPEVVANRLLLLATVYRHLGIDPRQMFIDWAGRPISILPSGQPIAELL